jgi:hypothetical protein
MKEGLLGLPNPSVRRERELARYRLHLVRHRTTLKNRIHATLMTFGHPCPVSDLFGLTIELKRQGAAHRYIPLLCLLVSKRDVDWELREAGPGGRASKLARPHRASQLSITT